MAEKRTKLKKSMGPGSIWAVAVGSIIGWGCFIQGGLWTQRAGGPLPFFLGFLVGGLLGGGALGSAPGITIIPEEFGIKILTLPVGGFLTLGCLIALMQWALAKSAKKKEGK